MYNIKYTSSIHQVYIMYLPCIYHVYVCVFPFIVIIMCWSGHLQCILVGILQNPSPEMASHRPRCTRAPDGATARSPTSGAGKRATSFELPQLWCWIFAAYWNFLSLKNLRLNFLGLFVPKFKSIVPDPSFCRFFFNSSAIKIYKNRPERQSRAIHRPSHVATRFFGKPSEKVKGSRRSNKAPAKCRRPKWIAAVDRWLLVFFWSSGTIYFTHKKLDHTRSDFGIWR